MTTQQWTDGFRRLAQVYPFPTPEARLQSLKTEQARLLDRSASAHQMYAFGMCTQADVDTVLDEVRPQLDAVAQVIAELEQNS